MDQAEQLDVHEISDSHNTAPRIARLGDRAAAAFLDAFIPFPLFFLSGTLEAIRVHAVQDDGSFNLTGGPALLSMTIMVLGWMAYAVIAEYRFGGTIGKHVMGIRVRAIDGRPITLLQSLARNLARFVDIIGFYLVGFFAAISSDKSQRIGDRVANTAVFEVEKSDRVYALLLGIAVFVVGIFLNTLVQYIAARQS